jgi:RNA polymerase subunit RPABC4/transcription elongation factor Spt4
VEHLVCTRCGQHTENESQCRICKRNRRKIIFLWLIPLVIIMITSVATASYVFYEEKMIEPHVNQLRNNAELFVFEQRFVEAEIELKKARTFRPNDSKIIYELTNIQYAKYVQEKLNQTILLMNVRKLQEANETLNEAKFHLQQVDSEQIYVILQREIDNVSVQLVIEHLLLEVEEADTFNDFGIILSKLASLKVTEAEKAVKVVKRKMVTFAIAEAEKAIANADKEKAIEIIEYALLFDTMNERLNAFKVEKLH